MKIIMFSYVIGGLYAIFAAGYSVYDIIINKKRYAAEAVPPKMMVALLILFLVAPMYWYYDHIMDPVLDGHYVITVQLSENKAEVVDVDLSVSSYIHEEEYESFSGGYEHTVLKKKRIYTAYVNQIILPDGRIFSINQDIHEGECIDLWDYTYDETVPSQEIDIWPLSKTKLGITNEDIWKKQTLGTIYEPVIIEISCAYLLIQYYFHKRIGRK